jgi:imidazolonepropionase-like amidohydrolase
LRSEAPLSSKFRTQKDRHFDRSRSRLIVNGEVEKSAFPPHPSAIMSKTTIKMSTKTAQLTTFLPSKTSHFQLQTPEELLGRAGLTFRRLLAALTTAPTKRLGFAATAGRVADGQDDLVIFDSDPADDIMAFSRTKMTLRRGRIIYRAEGQ